MRLDAIMTAARACQHCAELLPHPPRPVLRMGQGARIVVVGQAPGARVHASGQPWADDSGERLLTWLGVDRATFDDPEQFAILPMGFCYPGKGKSGDLPPRPECAPLWHARLIAALPNLRMTILAGQYAQTHYLGDRRASTLTETVRRWRTFAPQTWVPPHPSWRSRLLLAKEPWIESELLPALRSAVAQVLAGPSCCCSPSE